MELFFLTLMLNHEAYGLIFFSSSFVGLFIGLAEAGIISSKLSNHNMPSAESGHLKFSPER